MEMTDLSGAKIAIVGLKMKLSVALQMKNHLCPLAQYSRDSCHRIFHETSGNLI